MPFRTDLAVERTQPYADRLPDGVTQKECKYYSLTFNTVEISTSEGAKAIGKPIGRYVTITTPPFYGSSEPSDEEMEAIAKEISFFLPNDGLVLIVGLGNNDITPDAIGPRTVHQVLATRHFTGESAKQAGLDFLRPAASIAPGVLGQTGIETSEIIGSIVKDIKPSVIVVIDALAARDVSRLGNTIQIANTGISPGSGVQNSRRELSEHTLGIPVISIGIPTVVDAATLVNDLFDGTTLPEKQKQLLHDNGSMMITPREIDVLIGHACKVLAYSINKAIHPDMSFEEINYLVS